MKGTVIQIGQLTWHKDRIYEYYPVKIRLENRDIVFLQLVPQYSNFKNWSFILKTGVKTVLDNLQLVSSAPKFINKDYIPVIVSEPKKEKIIKQGTLL